jgi:carboxylesterase
MSIPSSTYKVHGGKTGVLLIHGLCGTPAEMRFVAMGLGRAGYTVHCPLLAGHGGSREDTVNSTWKDWYRSAELALDELHRECDRVIVGGLCLGSILALHLAANHPDKVRGVLLYSPTLWINGWAMPWYMKLFRLVPCKFMASYFQFPDVETLGIKCDRVREFVKTALSSMDCSDMGTAGTPAATVIEHRWMVQALQGNLGKIRQPTLIVHSREDDHADINNATYLQRALGGIVDTVVLQDSYHMVTLDRQRHIVVDASRIFIDRLVREGPQAEACETQAARPEPAPASVVRMAGAGVSAGIAALHGDRTAETAAGCPA